MQRFVRPRDDIELEKDLILGNKCLYLGIRGQEDMSYAPC